MSTIATIISAGASYLFKFKIASKIIAGLVILFNLIGLITGGISGLFMGLFITAVAICPVLFVLGIIAHIKSYPFRKQRQMYNDMFQEIKLIAPNGECPEFLGEEHTEYLKILIFKSLIPLKEWYSKQSLLETYFNTDITKIIQNPEDNNLVHLFAVTKPLPETALWNGSHYLYRNPELLNLGVDYEGCVTMDLQKNPHTFIAGETGSGKSNILKCLIYQCLAKGHIVKLIDFKRGVSFAVFDELVEIVADYEKIKIVLEELIQETNRRLDMLREHRVEDITAYNGIVPKGEEMKRIVVFIDELAELMRAGDKETSKSILNSLETLTRLSRAVGINLIMGIQRPDSTIITGQIKNNVSLRICGRFVDKEPSRIMLGNDRATKLPKIRGRFIFKDDEYREFQAFRITEEQMPYVRWKRDNPIKGREKKVVEEIPEPPIVRDIPEPAPVTTESKLDFGFKDPIRFLLRKICKR